MKILIHGAVTGTNFGDCLYAQIYSDYVRKISDNIEVLFWKNRHYGASRHIRRLCNAKVTSSLKDIDGLIYMPGGYFSQQGNPYCRIKQYFELGAQCLELNKWILISAVGGEVVKDEFFSKTIAPIVQKASLVSVRNERTLNTFKTYFGVEPIKLFDVILQVKELQLNLPNSRFFENILRCKQQGKKIVFLHVFGRNKHNTIYEQKVVPSLNKYIDGKNIHVIIGTDYIPRNFCKDISRLEIFKNVKGDKSAYTYTTPLELCALLKLCDTVITPKLHVGVVSATFGKSVLSFAKDYSKTNEFYKEIGYSERCISLAEANDCSVMDNLEKYAEIPMEISDELFDISKKNLDLLKFQILKMSKNKGD